MPVKRGGLKEKSVFEFLVIAIYLQALFKLDPAGTISPKSGG